MFGGKRLILVGLIVTLLIAIPVTIYLAQTQQSTQSHATKATTISLCSSGANSISSCNSNIKGNVGTPITLDVVVDPTTNIVNSIILKIHYDVTKFDNPQISANATVMSALTQPTYNNGDISVTLYVTNQANVIQTPTKVATLTLTPKNPTAGTATTVAITDQTQVQSNNCDRSTSTSNCPDAPGENVLAQAGSAQVSIDGSGTTTPTATPGPGGTDTPNQPPTCTSLNVDRTTSGSAPFSISFTGNGTDSNGTINKASFNFGDGPVVDVTAGGGLGGNTVSVPNSHTYVNPGIFTASVTFTDNSGATSNPATCQQIISVSGTNGTINGGTNNGSSSAQPTQTIIYVTATPIPGAAAVDNGTKGGQLPATGPGDALLGIGIGGIALSILGGLVFLAL